MIHRDMDGRFRPAPPAPSHWHIGDRDDRPGDDCDDCRPIAELVAGSTVQVENPDSRWHGLIAHIQRVHGEPGARTLFVTFGNEHSAGGRGPAWPFGEGELRPPTRYER